MRYQEILEACWKGYRQAGMKKKGDRQVPNCVPVSEQQMEEDLKKWFKEKWVRFGPNGKIRGDCARGSGSEGKPKCLPQAKAQALGKKGRASSAAKKRREDPNPERRGAAKNVATKVQEQGVAEVQSDPTFVKFMNRSLEKSVDEPHTTKPGQAPLMKIDFPHANFRTALEFGVKFIGRLSPAQKSKMLSRVQQDPYYVEDVLANAAEKLGMDDVMWEDFNECQDFLGEYFADPSINSWADLLSDSQVKEEEDLDEKQDACYRKVKSRYKVWPSAYASGALVQCRKKGAANWGNKDKK